MKKSPSPRGVSRLPESLLRQVNLYALGATATGVGFLTLAKPAEAKVAYAWPLGARGIGNPILARTTNSSDDSLDSRVAFLKPGKFNDSVLIANNRLLPKTLIVVVISPLPSSTFPANSQNV